MYDASGYDVPQINKDGFKGSLCALGDILHAIAEFEENFRAKYGLCLNEGMLLCRLGSGALSSSVIADTLGLSCSNTSKIIKSVEKKNLVIRNMGTDDKRMMIFELSESGKRLLEKIRTERFDIDTLFNIKCDCGECRGKVSPYIK